ncbi:MAG: hypothetical protein ABFD89_26870, partial [Bryobacteraceae bacterium]
LEQVERTKEKAVRFVRDVLGDDERADEIEAESPQEYAERKRIEIVTNPRKETRQMARATRSTTPTRDELKDRIEELESENQELQEKLDSIAEVLDEEEQSDDEDDDSEDEDDEEEA